MNEKRIIKFNMYMSCVILCVLVIVMIATTFAYFTSTKQVSNTFTSGRVDITLSEAAVKRVESGDLVKDDSRDRIYGNADATFNNYGRVYPGQYVYKDPTITNVGDSPEWIAAKVVFTDGAGDLNKIMGYEGYEDIDIEVLLKGGLLAENVVVGKWNGIKDVCYNDRYAMIQVANATQGRYEFFFLMLQPVQPNESVVIFDHILFPEEWNNEEMRELEHLTVHVQAFGVQMTELDSCMEAMTEAFPEHFKFN